MYAKALNLIESYNYMYESGELEKELSILNLSFDLTVNELFLSKTGLSFDKSRNSIKIHSIVDDSLSTLSVKEIIKKSLLKLELVKKAILEDNIYDVLLDDNLILVNYDNLNSILKYSMNLYFNDYSKSLNFKLLFPEFKKEIFNFITGDGYCLRFKYAKLFKELNYLELEDDIINMVSNDDYNNRDLLDTFADDKDFLIKLRNRVLDNTSNDQKELKLKQINQLYSIKE